MKKLIIISCLIFCFVNFSKAQRTAAEIGISKEFFKKLEIGITPQLRLRENFDVKEYFFDAEINYQVFKYLNLGSTYRYGNNITKKGKTENFGRISFDAKTGYKIKRFEPQFRLRFTNDDDFSDETAESINYLRYKFGLDYDVKKLKLTPYISAEFFQNLSVKEFDKRRYEGGLTYKFNKHHRVSAYFRNNNYLNGDAPVNYFGLAYKIKL